MQLGARWRAGTDPHRSVPPLLYTAIVAQESLHPDAESWTLTWLEGRPRCVLDDAAFVGLDARGRVLVGPAPGSGLPGDAPVANQDASGNDDDDDWLS